MNDEQHFFREMRDYFRFEAQRHRDIMGTLSDVTTQIAAINTALDAKSAAFTGAMDLLKASVDTSLADLKAAGAAGQSAIIDSIVVSLKDVMTKIDALEKADVDQIAALKAVITTAIAAVPVPTAASSS